jgi:hypothetical protein
MDETYVKVGGQWKYLYRAVDKAGNTVDFLLTAKRDRAAAQRFLTRTIFLRAALPCLPCLPFQRARAAQAAPSRL